MFTAGPTGSIGLPTARLAIVDYKTGAPPNQKAVDAGFALQLGLLGLIGRSGRVRRACSGDPEAFEYWSLRRYRGKFGRLMCPDKDMQPRRIPRPCLHEFRARLRRNG